VKKQFKFTFSKKAVEIENFITNFKLFIYLIKSFKINSKLKTIIK